MDVFWEFIIVMKSDTITAVATGMVDSGIAIIRISGEDAIQITDKIYESKSGKSCFREFSSHTIHYGYIVDKSNGQRSIIDEVMVSLMKAPNSYTAEDTVEINCHGGVLMTKRILETVIRNGARLAEPGEFTKRAFLNGRIDLSKAEAVMDIIHAKNNLALKNSVNQLRGSVFDFIQKIRNDILYEIAYIESALDDPEHISLEGYREKLLEKTDDILGSLKKWMDSFDNGKILKEGIRTVIVGKPNVGKSSFLNLFTGEEKAIVTDIAGTTRDVLEESIYLDGIHLNMVDTAGIRQTTDKVEEIGVGKARKYADEADLILYVIDASVPLDENDYDIMEMISDKKFIILFNKTDLENCITEDMVKCEFLLRVPDDFLSDFPLIRTSVKENKGMDRLEEMIKDMFFHGDISYDNESIITNVRHKEAMMDAYESMLQVKVSIENDMPEDFYSIDLMSSYASLGKIIGEEVGEDLVNEIFSKFCMGK